jgi:hypothetical protein
MTGLRAPSTATEIRDYTRDAAVTRDASSCGDAVQETSIDAFDLLSWNGLRDEVTSRDISLHFRSLG